jgi:transforming growth factor-beta-induced protein
MKMQLLRRLPLFGALAIALSLSACDSADPAGPQQNLAQLIDSRTDLTILTAAVGEADLGGVLASSDNTFTVFAPTDAAFQALLTATGLAAGDLLASDLLADILLYHVTTGRVLAGDLSAGQTVTSARPAGAATFTVVAAAGGFGLDTNGDGQADARITTTNLEASNGVVHIIDAVLVPQDIDLGPGPDANLAETVAGRDDLTVLTTALGATGLDAVLADAGTEYTVFAPTDAAFVALLGALQLTAEELLALDGIDGVLLFHVTAGTVLAGDLSAGQTVTTARASGANTFTIVSVNGGFGIDVNGDGTADALITEADVLATNGVVHILDAVLVPTDF